MKKNSPYFSLFILLYPIWFCIYTYQALRYYNLPALKNFYRGMRDGFRLTLSDYKNELSKNN